MNLKATLRIILKSPLAFTYVYPKMTGRRYKQLFLSQILKSKKSLQWSKPLSNATMPKDVSQSRDSTALSELIIVVICTALRVKKFRSSNSVSQSIQVVWLHTLPECHVQSCTIYDWLHVEHGGPIRLYNWVTLYLPCYKYFHDICNAAKIISQHISQTISCHSAVWHDCLSMHLILFKDQTIFISQVYFQRQ